jgi:hypothetical protein
MATRATRSRYEGRVNTIRRAASFHTIQGPTRDARTLATLVSQRLHPRQAPSSGLAPCRHPPDSPSMTISPPSSTRSVVASAIATTTMATPRVNLEATIAYGICRIKIGRLIKIKSGLRFSKRGALPPPSADLTWHGSMGCVPTPQVDVVVVAVVVALWIELHLWAAAARGPAHSRTLDLLSEPRRLHYSARCASERRFDVVRLDVNARFTHSRRYLDAFSAAVVGKRLPEKAIERQI